MNHFYPIPTKFSVRRSAPLHRDRVALKQTQVMQRQKTRPPNADVLRSISFAPGFLWNSKITTEHIWTPDRSIQCGESIAIWLIRLIRNHFTHWSNSIKLNQTHWLIDSFDLIWSHLISFELIHKASSHRCLFWQQRCCAHDDVTLPQGIHFLALQAPNPMTTRLKHSKRAQRSDGNTPRLLHRSRGLFGAIWGSRLSLLFRWGKNLVLWSATLLQRPRIKTHTSKEHAAMHAMRVTSRDITESCRYIHYIGYRWWIICYCYCLWLYDKSI